MTLTRRLIVWFGRAHVRAYEATDGRVGAKLVRKPMAILWTTGRRSGLVRSTALLCMPRGDDIVVVASFYGAANHPAWYLNLVDEPNCTVRFGRRKFAAVARTAVDDERSTLWSELTTSWPAYNGYQANTDREIPVVVLSPVTGN